MDFLPDLSTITDWLVRYGCVSLFGLLILGIIILPIPEGTLMLIAGALMRSGKLSVLGTIFAAFAGSVCGITLSYLLGRSVDIYFIHKYGKWIGLSPTRLEKTHRWFTHYGKWALTFGYFLPGIRHFTGLLAGITKLNLKQFMLFAYSGAAIWVFTFLFIGYFFGHLGMAAFEKIEFTFDTAILISLVTLALIAVGYVIYLVIKKTKKS